MIRTMNCKGKEDHQLEEEEGKERPVRKRVCRGEEEQDTTLYASMVEMRPQHQTFVHLDGAGADDGHQPPHHQHQGDGGEAGEEYNNRKKFLYDLVGQQPHQQH